MTTLYFPVFHISDIFTDTTMNTPIFSALQSSILSVYMGGSDPLKVCRYLIQSGCNINHENRVGSTPLQMALDNQLCEVAVMFLQAGCSLRSPVWSTLDSHCKSISSDNDCPELYELFIEKLRNPPTLKDRCRELLWNTLSRSWPYRWKVRGLPLPSLIKQFLLFSDI